MFKPYDIERAAGRHFGQHSADTHGVAPRSKMVFRGGKFVDPDEEAKKVQAMAETRRAKQAKKLVAKSKPAPVVEKVEVVAPPPVVQDPETDEAAIRDAQFKLLGVLTARRNQLERQEIDEANMLKAARQKLVERIKHMDPGIYQGDDLANWMAYVETAEMSDIEQANRQFDAYDAYRLEQKAERDREERQREADLRQKQEDEAEAKRQREAKERADKEERDRQAYQEWRIKLRREAEIEQERRAEEACQLAAKHEALRQFISEVSDQVITDVYWRGREQFLTTIELCSVDDLELWRSRLQERCERYTSQGRDWRRPKKRRAGGASMDEILGRVKVAPVRVLPELKHKEMYVAPSPKTRSSTSSQASNQMTELDQLEARICLLDDNVVKRLHGVITAEVKMTWPTQRRMLEMVGKVAPSQMWPFVLACERAKEKMTAQPKVEAAAK